MGRVEQAIFSLSDRLAQLRDVAEGIERKLLQSSGRGGYDGFVPSKASRAIGNGRCKLHPHTATACRLCLVQGLQG